MSQQSVYGVFQNTDMELGKGSLEIISVWANLNDAHSYIMNQPGLQDSKQEPMDLQPEPDPQKDVWEYSGYCIKRLAVRVKYDPHKEQDLREERLRLEREKTIIERKLEAIS